MILYLCSGLLIGLFFIVFMVQNTMPVTVHFLNWNLVGSLALILLLTFIIGIIISLSVAIPVVLKKKKKATQPDSTNYAKR